MGIELFYHLNREIINLYTYLGIAFLLFVIITSYVIDMVNEVKNYFNDLYDYYYYH